MIKSFNEYSVNESKVAGIPQERPTQEQFNILKDHLQELEDLMNTTLGCKKGDIKLELYWNRKSIGLRSNDLRFLLGNTLSKTLFTKINVECWGGQYMADTNSIYFDPRIWYHHLNGSSNGTQFIWYNIYFNLDTNKWETSGLVFK